MQQSMRTLNHTEILASLIIDLIYTTTSLRAQTEFE